jgi:hypothetical protein
MVTNTATRTTTTNTNTNTDGLFPDLVPGTYNLQVSVYSNPTRLNISR